MKSLFLWRLLVWPRFRAEVKAALSVCAPEVVEIEVKPTPNQKVIATALSDLMERALRDLRANAHIDAGNLNFRRGLLSTFDFVIRRQLSSVWHTIPRQTKSRLFDVKSLRGVAEQLFRLDSVSFLRFLDAVRVAEGMGSSWLFMDSAIAVFENARKRVYTVSKRNMHDSETQVVSPVLEQPPIWRTLKNVLTEIQHERFELLASGVDHTSIVVVCANESTCKQLSRSLLPNGGRAYMESLYAQYVAVRARSRKLKTTKKAAAFSAYDMIPFGTDDDAFRGSGRRRKRCRNEDTTEDISDPIFDGLHWFVLESRQWNELIDIQPRFVVLCDVNLAIIRQLEMLSASFLQKIRVYHLTYPSDSLATMKYMATVERETESMARLIGIKERMIAPVDGQGNAVIQGQTREEQLFHDDTMFEALSQGFAGRSNHISRIGGRGENARRTRKIVVDAREFGSQLPCVLYSMGMTIIPVVIEVGDYVLSPKIVVERKTIPDLISSLASGRLYSQAARMCKTYDTAILLIEFCADKTFILRQENEIGNEIDSRSLTSKLTLLLLHNPSLRLLWSRSLRHTASLFWELKNNQTEPSPDMAMSVSSSPENGRDCQDLRHETTNYDAFAMLRSLPGVSEAGIRNILSNYRSLADVAKCSQETLIHLLGGERPARALYTFLNSQCPGS